MIKLFLKKTEKNRNLKIRVFKSDFYPTPICFTGILFLFLFSLSSCESPLLVLPSFDEGKSPSFFKSRQAEDPDRTEIFKELEKFYKGKKKCSSAFSCVSFCDQLFFLDPDKEACLEFPLPQIYRFKKLYHYILEKEFDSLMEINTFDLKVFFNFSPEPLYRVFKTFGPFFTKIFLKWIVTDWKVAKIFKEEDWDFLFLEIFLNGLSVSPINSLRGVLAEGRTFVELAWLKQNDFALFWLDGYLKEVQCLNFEGQALENCVLTQYCLLSGILQNDVSKEIMTFERLKQRVNKRPEWPQTDLKSFCSAFCSSKEGQKGCSSFF